MIETMIGNSIANQCSPVLMDVKPSNLLILTREEEEGFLAHNNCCNNHCNSCTAD